MLVLRLKSEPFWLDLPMGVRLRVLPLGRSLAREARDDLAQEAGAGLDADAVPGANDDAEIDSERNSGSDRASNDRTRSRDTSGDPSFDAFALAVAKRGILEWQGVMTPDGGPAEVTPAAIAALMDHPVIWTRVMQDYISPGFGVVAEGNGSAPSPNGILARARTTAAPVTAPAPTAPHD